MKCQHNLDKIGQEGLSDEQKQILAELRRCLVQ